MKVINLNTQEGVRTLLYPDNQPHVNVKNYHEVNAGEENYICVICSITDSKKLLELCMVKDAADRMYPDHAIDLHIPYLMAARFDQVFQEGDSFDLKVIARIINSLDFDNVNLYDAHSAVAPALIDRSANHSNQFMVEHYETGTPAVLIIPDAGAAKKASKYMEWNSDIKDIVHCVKSRDIKNGNLTLKVLEPEKCKGRNCVIIDDLCDGGGTFLMIANQIEPNHLTLIVTHGIFSKGFHELEDAFNHIIVSDSYRESYNSKIVEVVKIAPIFIHDAEVL